MWGVESSKHARLWALRGPASLEAMDSKATTVNAHGRAAVVRIHEKRRPRVRSNFGIEETSLSPPTLLYDGEILEDEHMISKQDFGNPIIGACRRGVRLDNFASPWLVRE